MTSFHSPAVRQQLIDVMLGILLFLPPTRLRLLRFPSCWKQLQICFYAHVGGFLLALLQGSAPPLEGPCPTPYTTLFFFADFACCFPPFLDNSQEPGAGVPEQFTGLLHGSSPVFDCHDEPFRLPGVPSPSQKQPESRKPTKAKETVAAAASQPSRPNMAAILTDCDPKAIYATVNKEPRDSGAGAASAVRMRPPGDLKLARSLSKSDSDLLVSPPGEEEGGLGNRSESVSNCSTGKKRLEKSPSFTSEWDEVSDILLFSPYDIPKNKQTKKVYFSLKCLYFYFPSPVSCLL